MYTIPKIRGPIKIHGGKSYLARRIITLFGDTSRYHTFMEPTVGGGAVPLNLEFDGEVHVSDLNPDVVYVWQSIQSQPMKVHGFLKSLKYDKATFAKIRDNVFFFGRSKAAMAARYIARSRMSRGGLGLDLAWSERTRGGKPGDLNSWETFLNEDFFMIHHKIKNWKITNRCMSVALREQCSPATLVYIDPPYVHESRVTRDAYTYEMPTRDHDADADQSLLSHEGMISLIMSLKAKFFISAYDHPLYDAYLHPRHSIGSRWKRHTWDIANHSGQGETKQRRTEVVWEGP